MSAQNGSANVQEQVADKGKGKGAAPQDTGMEVDESSSDEDVDETLDENEQTADEPDEDNMEEIDQSNIIDSGRRTRGVKIDFAKAAQDMPAEEEDEDEDDDFEAPAEDEDHEMK